VVAPEAVHVWLPHKAAGIDTLLPVFCAEQALLIGAIPSITLLQATGRFGQLGAIQAVQSVVGVVATTLLMPRWGALGFAMASVGSTAVCLVPGAIIAEYAHWSSLGRRPIVVLWSRIVLAIAALACAPMMWASRAAASGLALAVFAAGTWHALRALRVDLRQTTPPSSSGDPR
jgi:O-antigen/teichoic acid export membrane protein